MQQQKLHTIYLVDDDLEDQEIFSDAIEMIDTKVNLKLFDNGVDLMADLYADTPLPDVIFLDLYMPLMNGEECLKDIRQNEEFDKVPLVIYSSILDMDKIDELFEMGANRYLHKPSTFNALVTALDRTMASVKRNKLGGTAVINVIS